MRAYLPPAISDFGTQTANTRLCFYTKHVEVVVDDSIRNHTIPLQVQHHTILALTFAKDGDVDFPQFKKFYYERW